MKHLPYFFIAGVIATSFSHNAISSELINSGKYVIDQNHSSVTFEIDHLGYTNVIGRFNDVKGNFTQKADQSSLNVSIQSASIDTNHDKRDAHLRSPDFFNVKQFPIISFYSPLEITDNNGETIIEGKLELLGVSKPITLNIKKGKEGTDPWGNHRAGYSATGVIKRSDYGMNFMQGGLSDDVRVNINIEAIKK
jgi:polyisoprenoid-binding protein YceI